MRTERNRQEMRGIVPDGRAQVLQELRKGQASVNDLADILGITPNGVRAHIATLGREGLIESHGRRKGSRRPETLYRLTVRGDELFPKAYALVLEQTLQTLEREFSTIDYERLVDQIGADLADRIRGGRSGNLTPAEATDALIALGAQGALVDDGNDILFDGTACPVAAVAPHASYVCRIAASILGNLTGLNVREECLREARPHCAFRFVGSG